ncbi:hypothetical protein ACLMJK_003996 [Lecanora helva]
MASRHSLRWFDPQDYSPTLNNLRNVLELASEATKGLSGALGVGNDSILLTLFIDISSITGILSHLRQFLFTDSPKHKWKETVRRLCTTSAPMAQFEDSLKMLVEMIKSNISSSAIAKHSLDDFTEKDDLQRMAATIKAQRKVLTLALSNDRDDHSKAIAIHIRNFIQNQRELEPSFQRDLEDWLIRHAEGSFPWVTDGLCNLREPKDPKKIWFTVATEIDKSYCFQLGFIQDKYVAIARKAFQWLSFSQRPLYVEEVAEAAIIDSPGSLNNNQARFTNPYDIIDVCPTLISTFPTTKAEEYREHLNFTYHTFKDFLMYDTEVHNAGRFFFSEFSAQKTISHDCLSYLLAWKELKGGRSDEHSQLPLLDYAATHWYDHLNVVRKQEGLSRSLANLVVRVFDARHRNTPFKRPSAPPANEVEGPDALRPDRPGIPSPLYFASLLGLEEVVQILLDRGDHKDESGGFCGRPLQAASLGGHDSIVSKLLQHRADINVVHPCGHYGSPVQAAAHHGYKNTVQILLKYDLDPSLQSGFYGSALQAAADGGFTDVVELLVEYGVDTNAKGGVYGTALIASARGGHTGTVKTLIENGAKIGDFEIEQHSTALYAAASLGHCETVTLLLERGADPNAVGGDFVTPLRAAVHGGYEDVVQVLMRFGAHTSTKIAPHLHPQHSALQMAVSKGHEGLTRLLLRRKSINADVQDDIGQTPLMTATHQGNAPIVRLLLENGASTRTRDCNGATALMTAADGGFVEIVRYLLEHGADSRATNTSQHSPLQIAKLQGHQAVVQLLEYEAFLSRRGKHGRFHALIHW